MRTTLVKTFTFEAAHWLPTFPDGHKCRRLHGHSFRADIHVSGALDPAVGYLMDYGDIKAACEPLRVALDHVCLNEIDGLSNPTSEMIAVWIWRRLKPQLPGLSLVVVHETCTSRCEFAGG